MTAARGAPADRVFIGGSFTYRYGTTTSYGSSTPAATLSSGIGAQSALSTLAGLAPSTTYHAQLVVTTPDGTATSPDVTFITSAAPAPPTPPRLSHVRLTHTRFRIASAATAVSAQQRKAPRGTTFTFTLSAAAKLTVAVSGKVPGLRQGGKCVAPTRALKRKHARRCTRTAVVGTLTRANEGAGVHSLAFSGRIGRHPLPPGGYTAKLTARNANGSSKPVSVSFTIVR